MTRFVLLAHARSGSFLLLYGLNQHPRILGFSEILAVEEKERLHFRLDDGRHYRDGEDGAAFLRDAVYVPRGERDVLGFKLFYRHAPTPPASAAWGYLASTPDVRVIHLYREKLLETLVSLRIAERTDEWLVLRDQKRTPKRVEPFELSSEACEQHFYRVLLARKQALERLAGLPRIDIEYETLCTRFDETMAACFRHLGVEPRSVEKQLVKQATRPVREQVLNYDELVRHFAGTPYARHL